MDHAAISQTVQRELNRETREQETEHLNPNQFDAVASFSVFEHLLMPWKVVIELNRVMRIDAIGLVTTHQT